MCDLAYECQREDIVRQALTEMTLAPHVEQAGQIATPEVAVAEFDRWLDEEPRELREGAEFELEDLIAGGRR